MRLTLKELLAVCEIHENMFKADRLRGHLGLAFGQDYAYASLSYLPSDAVGLLLTGTLALSYPKLFAARLTRVHWDQWMRALAISEHDPDAMAQFCVLDCVTRSGKEAHLASWAKGSMDPERIAALLAATPEMAGAEPTRISCVLMARLTRAIRENAARIGLDLSRPFLPPPGDAELERLLTDYETEKARAIAEVSAKKLDVLAAKRGARARAIAEAWASAPGHA